MREPVGVEPSTTWALSSGAQAYVWRAPTTIAPDALRGAVILQHGYGEYARRYVSQHCQLIPTLLDIGLDVYALDAWGHGSSPGRRGMAHLGRSVRDHVELRHKVTLGVRSENFPVFAFGHSLGGLITAGSVVSDVAGLAGVVLSSPALPAPASRGLRRGLGVAALIAPGVRIPQRPAAVSALSRVPEAVARAEADDGLLTKQIPFLVAATSLDVAATVWTSTPTWHVPTLVLHGSRDVYTDPAGSRRFNDAIASPDKKLHIVEGGFHELLNDLDADATLALIVTWLRDRVDVRPIA